MTMTDVLTVLLTLAICFVICGMYLAFFRSVILNVHSAASRPAISRIALGRRADRVDRRG